MDIKKIPQQYPFLKNLLKSYKEYDESVTEGHELYTFFDNNVHPHDENKIKYRETFVKLLKNLKYSNEQYKSTNDFENCRYLYQWIYHTTKQLGNLEMIISILFQKFNEQDNPTSKIKKCPYYTYRSYNEDSENIIKLHICEDNIFNIQDILKDTQKENRCLGRKLLYECVNIYKKINENYCLTGKDTSTNEICSQLGTFKLFYTSYISSAAGIKEEIPSLHTPINIFNDQCSLNAQTKAPSREEDDNPGRSIPQRVPSALGVIAGVPPLLAFSPINKWFKFRNKTHRTILPNKDGELENYLISHELEDTSINPVRPKYNVAYGPV